ncbi:MAG: DUF3721 domain-containing protein [Cyanobacteriota bacterium]|jgi:hypothetical protein
MGCRFPLVALFGFVIALPVAALAQAPNSKPLPALYATKAEAERAAKLFQCSGAHPMGDKWMPCASPGHGHGGSTGSH